jgi:hypothetical protein
LREYIVKINFDADDTLDAMRVMESLLKMLEDEGRGWIDSGVYEVLEED